jgi:hypothetical protein
MQPVLLQVTGILDRNDRGCVFLADQGLPEWLAGSCGAPGATAPPTDANAIKPFAAPRCGRACIPNMTYHTSATQKKTNIIHPSSHVRLIR